MLKSIKTRFRAYQLGCAGASYSYFADGHFTLIEAMITELNEPRILEELEACGKEHIDTLHITSWDSDHCSESGLKWIFEHLQPTRVEYPGYDHDTDCAKASKKLILEYAAQRRVRAAKAQRIDPPYIQSLEKMEGPGYSDLLYHPKELQEGSNDNSTIKFFRKGSFNVVRLTSLFWPTMAPITALPLRNFWKSLTHHYPFAPATTTTITTTLAKKSVT